MALRGRRSYLAHPIRTPISAKQPPPHSSPIRSLLPPPVSGIYGAFDKLFEMELT